MRRGGNDCAEGRFENDWARALPVGSPRGAVEEEERSGESVVARRRNATDKVESAVLLCLKLSLASPLQYSVVCTVMLVFHHRTLNAGGREMESRLALCSLNFQLDSSAFYSLRCRVSQSVVHCVDRS